MRGTAVTGAVAAVLLYWQKSTNKDITIQLLLSKNKSYLTAILHTLYQIQYNQFIINIMQEGVCG